MFEVVSPHLVERILRSEDVVDQVEHDEAMVDNLNDVLFLLLLAAESGVLFGKEEGFKIDDHFFQVEAVEGDDIGLQVVLLAALHLYLDIRLCILPLHVEFGHDVLLNFSLEVLCKVAIHRLLDDGMPSDQCFDALDDIFVFESFEIVGDKLLFFGHFAFVFRVGYVYVDVVAVSVLDVDIDVDVLSVLVGQEVAGCEISDCLGMRHVVAAIDFALLEHLFDLILRSKQSLEHGSSSVK